MKKTVLLLTIAVIGTATIISLLQDEDSKPELDLSLNKPEPVKEKPKELALDAVKIEGPKIAILKQAPYIRDLTLVADVQPPKPSNIPHKYFVKTTPYPAESKVRVPIYISDEVSQLIEDVHLEMGTLTRNHWREQFQRNKDNRDEEEDYDDNIPPEEIAYEKKLKELKEKIEKIKKTNNINSTDWRNRENFIKIRDHLEVMNTKLNTADPSDKKYKSMTKRLKRNIEKKEAELEEARNLLGVKP